MPRNWRSNRKWFNFRAKVFSRDGGKCRICGGEELLRGAHVKPVENFPDMAFVLSNVITLCAICDARIGDKLEENRHLWERKVIHKLSTTHIDTKDKRYYVGAKVVNKPT